LHLYVKSDIVNFSFSVILQWLNIFICCWYYICGNYAPGGYGSCTLNVLRLLYGTMHRDSEFPLTLGRDFSGDIVDMGCGVDQSIYRIGDTVSHSLALCYWICL